MSSGLVSDAGEVMSQRAELALFSFAGPPDWRLTESSEAFSILLGLTPGEINGRALLEFVHADDVPAVSEGLADLGLGFPETLLECRFVQRDRRAVYLPWIARVSPGTERWHAASTDTAGLIELLTERRDLRTRLDLAIGQATAAMWELNVLEDHFTWEPQAAEILGVSPETIPGDAAALGAAVLPADSDAVHRALAQLLDDGATEVGLRIGQDASLRYLSLRGRILDRDSGGRPVRAVGLLLDVTTEKAMEEQLVRMSVSDGLTGSPNRRAFDQALRGEWRRCTRGREALSIVMIDIDGFKQFNDRFGHLVGDQALIAVARALTAALQREGDFVARYGGEEFSVVLPDTDTAGASVVARHLLEAARAVTVRQAPGWNVTVSVGSASWHPDRETIKATALLGRADEALYAAKRTGKDRAIAYEESLAARDSLHAAIASALERGELELHYQPIIGLASGDVTGFEALMRWDRPGHGRVDPSVFIPVAETTTLICDLDRWALREAAGQLAAWRREGLDDGSAWRMAVNVSARHAASATIVTDVEAALATAGIAPAQLELELSEAGLTDDLMAGPHLAAVRALGVAVAIDDFGTGDTSIAELARLPVDALKIDPQFTGSATPETQTLVRLMVKAGHAFDLRVVGKRVEEEDALQALRDLSCDAAQGYLLGRPMPADQIPVWLSDRHAVRARLSPAPA